MLMRRLALIVFLLLLWTPSVWAGTGCVANDPSETCTLSQINTRVQSAAYCGNTYYLAAGTISGDISATASCDDENDRMTISCSNGADGTEDLGECDFSGGNSVGFNGSDYITVKGMDFSNLSDAVDFVNGATYNRITECRFINPSVTDSGTIEIGFYTDYNQYNEIDHNTFIWTGGGGYYAIRHTIRQNQPTHNNIGTHIHHNVFDGHSHGGNYELMQIGRGSDLAEAEIPSYVVIEKNYIKDYYSDLAESISIKVANATIRYNTLIDCGGAITLRQSYNSQVYGNLIREVNYVNNGGNYKGIRIMGGNNYVYNNYLEGIEGQDGPAIVVRWGAPGAYIAAHDTVIANNVILYTHRGYHFNQGGSGTVAPTGLYYINNYGQAPAQASDSEIFGGGACSSSGNYWISNRGHGASGRDLVNTGCISSGVTDAGQYEYTTSRKTGLPLNWLMPNVYTNGTQVNHLGLTVPTDIQGQTRANPPDIGIDESGGSDTTEAVGNSWDGYGASVQVPSDAPTGPSISIAATDSTATETPGNPGIFTVSCTDNEGDCTTDVTSITFTRTGTATYTDDYTASPSLLTFGTPFSGGDSFTITITPVDDDEYDPDETVIYGISTVTGGTGSGSATITITDNETPPPLSEDEFDDGSLNTSIWTHLLPGTGGSYSEPGGGYLVLTASNGSCWDANFDPTLVSQPVYGDFDVYTHVSANVTTNYQHASLMFVEQASNNRVLSSRNYGTPTNDMVSRHDTDGCPSSCTSDNTLVGVASTLDDLYLRLKRVGSTFTAYYAATTPSVEDDWTTISLPSSSLTSSEDGYIGLASFDVGAAGAIQSNWDFFRNWEESTAPTISSATIGAVSRGVTRR